jgi:hypothetical protein
VNVSKVENQLRDAFPLVGPPLLACVERRKEACGLGTSQVTHFIAVMLTA